jgi:hypothetical protein
VVSAITNMIAAKVTIVLRMTPVRVDQPAVTLLAPFVSGECESTHIDRRLFAASLPAHPTPWRLIIRSDFRGPISRNYGSHFSRLLPIALVKSFAA